jgi:biopolymer transport protein ExbB/TolQ
MDIAEVVRQTGPFFWPILACAVFGAAISVERLIFVYLRASVDATSFLAAVQRHLLDDALDRAVGLCNGEPSALLPRVVKAALVRAHRPDPEIRDAVEEAQLEVFPLVNRRIAYLPVIANVSTLLGLLGTIQGLVIAFQAVEASSVEARSAALSGGIAVAMYTTFFGLLVSIPVLVAHALVASRANALLDEIEHGGLKVANLLAAVRPAPNVGAPVLPFPPRG